jgi:hypothetical protein
MKPVGFVFDDSPLSVRLPIARQLRLFYHRQHRTSGRRATSLRCHMHAKKVADRTRVARAAAAAAAFDDHFGRHDDSIFGLDGITIVGFRRSTTKRLMDDHESAIVTE